jgi:small conductance mechanosensitive channel
MLYVSLAVCLVAMATPALAQLGLPGVASAPAETAEEPTPPAAAQALIEVLRDDTARAALLAELERLALPPNGTAAAETVAGEEAAAATAEEQQPTVGRTLAVLTRELIDEAKEEASAFMAGLRATYRRLAMIWGPRAANLVKPMTDLVMVVAVTVVVYALLRSLVRRSYRRVSPALLEKGLLGRGLLFGFTAVLDLLAVVVAWAVGNIAVEVIQGVAASDAITQTLYLNAFLVVEVAKVAVGLVLAPRREGIRPVPLAETGARYWTWRFDGLISILGYGLMLAVPVVGQAISIFTARALTVVVYAFVLIWSIVLVIRHRHMPVAYLEAKAARADGDTTLRLIAALARVWHWPALVYLMTLFVIAVSSTAMIEPMLRTSLEVLLVIVVGIVAATLIGRGARRGISLPETLRDPLPLLEGRLNGFLQNLLGMLRLAIFLITVSVALRVAGVVDLVAVIERIMGRDFATTLVSVLVVVVVSFLLWLGMASWVDYRLNPARSVAPTARETTLLTLMRNAVTIAIVVITLMVTLSELGLDIAPLLASAGVLGLAIGFGSQRLVQDIITGIFIQFENAINVGDVVTVGGTTGAVEKLTIRSVSLRDVNGIYHIIPFSSVDMVSNYMRDFSFHVADIGIAYRESVDEAKALMFKAFDDLRAMPDFARVIIGPLDWHGVTTLGDSAVTLRARIRTRPGNQWAVGRAYNEAVKRRFDEAGVEIPFPHMTVWFGEDKQGEAPPVRMATPGGAVGATSVSSIGRPIQTRPFGQDAPNDDDQAEAAAEEGAQNR